MKYKKKYQPIDETIIDGYLFMKINVLMMGMLSIAYANADGFEVVYSGEPWPDLVLMKKKIKEVDNHDEI